MLQNVIAIMAPNKIVLILGSAPDAEGAVQWSKSANWQIVAINNAWQIRKDWDYVVFPEDFPDDRRPPDCLPEQQKIEADEFVPANNKFGGIVYAGGTMAFTAGYWVIAALKPDVLAYFGCDMIYSNAKTHFYGEGTADPLRADVTITSLEAKSARLMAIAAANGCACVNLSEQPESRLIFPRASLLQLDALHPAEKMHSKNLEIAMQAEKKLGYFVKNGKYWECSSKFSADALAEIDELWLAAVDDLDNLKLTPEDVTLA